MRITFSKTLLLATTAFSMISVPAANAYLSPLSFNEMYAHASRGNLTVLNNAILRGMNINAVNGDGDTGICVAIRRGDHIAYESFRNTGAHTRPRCLNNINAKQYKKFMADHRPYELAYRKEGSSIWWWIGGAAAVGGIALAAGGGGGGGGSDPLPVPAPEDPTFHSNKGLGYVVATSDPSEPETTPYEPVMISAEDKTTEVNRESIQLSNNAKMWVYNPDTFGYDTLLLSDLIDFDKDINSYTKYIRVGMRAYNDSVVINDTEQTISAGSGTVGLDALLNSSASNLGTIEISAPNGSIGMVASDYSEAGNTGTISMEFTGKDTADSLIGMYADTNSSLTNAGTISGKADTARGRVTGMQTRLTSYYADFVNKAVNSGKIELSGSSDNAGGMSLWGMSSWLDRAFIDGDKSAAKLDKATLTNKGDISLTFSLQPSDEEGAVDPEDPLTLAAGNGGIVGMHADANTTATNNGNITIAVTGDAGETLSAGMQAVRGGSIVNGSGKNITVSAEGSAYGMMAISGSNGGKNFTDVKSAVDNRGSITVTAGDTAYGIYSSVKGDVKNSGKITINGAGYGIFNQNGSVNSSGSIIVAGTGEKGSYGIYAEAEAGSIENSGVINLYGAGTAIYTASGTVNNTATSGIINIYTDGSADSFGIAAGSGNNGLISNSNKISITAQNGNASAKKNTGIAANNIKNSGTVQIGSSIQAIDKAIGLDGKSIDNDGEILLYGNNAAGIFSDDENADVTNNGRIELNGNGGIGISVTGGNGTVTNTGAITVTSSGRAYGIKNEAGSVENDAVITLNASSSYGILAKNIENSGEIYINKSSGYGLTATDGGSITNYGSITASGSANDGLYGQGSSSFHNEGNITIDGQGSWGLRSSNNVETYNSGRINMSGNKSYGMKIEKGTVENHGDITTADAESFGIWVNNVDSLTNSGTVTVNGADSVGIYAGGSSGATNSGTINVNGDGGKGINTTANSSFTNKGTINVNGKNGYGIYAEGTSKVTNSGDIYLNATTATKTSSALYAGGSAVIENSGNLHITASGNGYIWAAYAEGSGSIKNSGTIYVDKATDLIFSGNVTNNGTIEAAAGRMLLNEQVKFGSNARFVADEIAGTASVSADTVKQSNRTQFVLSGNFEGNTDRLNVRSESYLFDADFDGEKTTLSMKKFAEVENNASIAGFLQNNYGRNNSDLFDELKSASSQKELTKRISQISGRDVIPTMAEQNLALMKDLHRQFDNAWFNAAPDDKLIAGFNYYDRERGGYGNFAGSDDNAVSLFGIFRNNEGKNVSYGLGWSISKFDSKYDNGGKKDEVIAEILLPFGFGNENFRFLGNMYGGYGNGEYKRYAEGGRFTGDVENYYYGVNNELRGSFDAGFGISLQPTAEFNVAGLYQSGIDDGGLKTGHNNNLSVESGFGLYAEKEFLFNDENSLRLRFGGTWYHEFNDKYQTVKARLDGMEGCFAMDRAEYEKDRGLFSLNGEYRNGGFSFYGETAFEAGRSDNWIFNTGFKYAF